MKTSFYPRSAAAERSSNSLVNNYILMVSLIRVRRFLMNKTLGNNKIFASPSSLIESNGNTLVKFLGTDNAAYGSKNYPLGDRGHSKR